MPHEAVVFGLFCVKLNWLVELVAVAAEVVVLVVEENIAELVLNFVLFKFLGRRAQYYIGNSSLALAVLFEK